MDFTLHRIADFISWLFPKLDITPKTPSCSSPSNANSQLLQRQIWLPRITSYRKRRMDEYLYSFLFFFATMLDDTDLHSQLLADKGDAFLITAPRTSEHEKYGTHRKWMLIFLANDLVIIKAQVVYQNKQFVMQKERKVGLEEFIIRQGLRMVDRPIFFRPEQLQAALPITPALPFPIDPALLALGKLSQNTAYFDEKRRIPVMGLRVDAYDAELTTHIKTEALNMLTFGNERIWRLWGVCETSPTELTLVLEDISYGSLLSYVRSHWEEEHLVRFSLQLCQALRYLVKHEFFHQKLSLDCVLLTYSLNVKLAVYGLSPGHLLPLPDDHDDIERMRWLPWECIPIRHVPSGVCKEAYGQQAMCYTFGLMMWSMCHAGLLPFEDETADTIRDCNVRKNLTPEMEPELTPKGLDEVMKQCWHRKPAQRPFFKDLKHQLRHLLHKS